MRNLLTKKQGITLVEIMVVTAVFGLVLSVLVTMIQSGSSQIDSSMWYKENLTRMQLSVSRMAEDLYKASIINEYVYDATTGMDEIKETPSPFRYLAGSVVQDFKDPLTDAGVSRQTIPGTTSKVLDSDPERQIFSFTINHLGSIRNNTPTYTVRVNAYLQGGKLLYEKEFIGSPPTTPVAEVVFSKKEIAKNIDFIYMDHSPIYSEMDPTLVEGSLLRMVIHLRDLEEESAARSKGRTLSVNRTMKLSVPAVKVTSF